MAKKLKQDPDLHFRESLHRKLYPSPSDSHRRFSRKSEIDLSYISASIEHEVDALLKISLPEIQHSKINFAAISIKSSRMKEFPRRHSASGMEALEECPEPPKNRFTTSSMKISMSDIQCEFPIQQRSKPGTPKNEQTPRHQITFMEEVIRRYKQETARKLEEQKQAIFHPQEESKMAEEQLVRPKQPIKKKKDKRKRVFNTPNKAEIAMEKTKPLRRPEELYREEFEENHETEPHQDDLAEEIRDEEQQQEVSEEKNVKKAREAKQRMQRTKNTAIREEKQPKKQEKSFYQLKACRNWKGLRLRKEARNYPQYQNLEYERFFQKICPDFYVHEKEGIFSYVRVKKDFLIFELTVNPFQVIGPARLKSAVLCELVNRDQNAKKLCISYRKGKTIDKHDRAVTLKKSLLFANEHNKPIAVKLYAKV